MAKNFSPHSSLYVIKKSGEKDPFSWHKVYKSALRIGADKKLAKEIADTIKQEVYPGVKTETIFKRVLELLDKNNSCLATIFNLKESLRRLGPTGFPFEKYIGRIFEEEGFSVQLNQTIKGYCVSYEIDFLAQDKEILYIGECKFHQLAGNKVDLPEALANYARFLDIKKGGFFSSSPLVLKSLLVTNTKFTTQAIAYSQCVGVDLLGWRYPFDEGLEKLIETKKFYPITIFPEIQQYLLEIFLEEKIVLVKDLLVLDIKKFCQKNRLDFEKLANIINKAKKLLGANV